MAISCDRISSKGSNGSCKTDYDGCFSTVGVSADGSSVKSCRSKNLTTRQGLKSPYLSDDSKVHVKARVTEKHLLYKKGTTYTSSFPLAANIYKANSDEFKALKKAKKKVKKSVLTLPNTPAPAPQECTISDTNDSGYLKRVDAESKRKAKKRCPAMEKNRTMTINRDHYAASSSDMNTSSYELLRHIEGSRRKKTKSSDPHGKPPCNLWAMLKNFNRFELVPSPAISEESVVTPKARNKHSKKDCRVIETCRTEELRYISNFDVGTKTPNNFSQTSSIDRITVIDKQDLFHEFYKEFQKKVAESEDSMTRTKEDERKTMKRNQITKSPSKNFNRTVPKQLTKKEVQKSKDLSEKKPKERKHIFLSRQNTQSLVERNNDSFMNEVDNNSMNDDSSKHNLRLGEHVLHKSNVRINRLNNNLPIGRNVGSTKKSNHIFNKEYPNINGHTEDDRTNGIIKVVFNKCKDTSSERTVTNKTVKTLSTNTTEKNMSIKKVLAHIRFPIEILERDQVSSSFEVIGDDPIQFDGLENRIWPFMTDWYNEKGNKAIKKRKVVLPRLRDNSAAIGTNKDNTDLTKQYNQNFKERNTKMISRIQNDRLNSIESNKLRRYQSNKYESLKDNKVTLLFKKCSMSNISNVPTKPEAIEKISIKNNIGFKFLQKQKAQVRVAKPRDHVSLMKNQAINEGDVNSTASIVTVKAKDSFKSTNLNYHRTMSNINKKDFIKNVIQKINKGVYYNQDRISVCENKKKTGYDSAIESKTLVEAIIEDNDIKEHYEHNMSEIVPCLFDQNNDPLSTISGFDEKLPALEVKTINTKEMEIRHCIANISVFFDITTITGLGSILMDSQNSKLFVPKAITKDEHSIFKCTKALFNSVLPAELCTILPKMIRNILEFCQKSPSKPAIDNNSQSNLSVISEISKCESNLSPLLLRNSPSLKITSVVLKILEGTYTSVLNTTISELKLTVPKISETAWQVCDVWNSSLVMPMIVMEPRIFKLHCFSTELQSTFQSAKSVEVFIPMYKECKQLIPYVAPSTTIRYILNQTKPNKKTLAIDDRLCAVKLALTEYFIGNECRCVKHDIWNVINIVLPMDDIAQQKMNFTALEYGRTRPVNKCLELCQKDKHKPYTAQCALPIKKIKKCGPIKLKRKSKSSSSISNEKVFTVMNKITSLEEFMTSMGVCKNLANVFDGHLENRLLACLKEMKRWVSEISSRQSLLLLLLINKKESQSLIRFRPIILHAIAMNRITRSSELDMEIEVIERENLNKYSQHLAIPNTLTALDKASLFEELCWIAKTTASDHQKTFDKTSEKLLWNLLEKRKRLSPSYLRVMARYVGLGLLKLPKKGTTVHLR